MENIIEKKIGDVVAENFRTAAVFSNYGIDFCCRGNRIIKDVCEKQDIDVNELDEKLRRALNTGGTTDADYKTWALSRLIDHIETTHHRYVEEKIPVLLQFLDKLCKVHGGSHPELFEINEHFKHTAGELSQHLKKEELVLFPHIKRLEKAQLANEEVATPGFGTVKNPIAMMMQEHENEGDRFVKIAALSNQYTPPADACNTYRITYAMLDEFEKDLHTHIHLENNILFPKAVELEAVLS
ncbi:iron-sulfur cluster repair di-iron protein [Joostella atrarenae]|uniref:Iron-sulfur cluster repair di-iron protein n=1 Tax=Joostella atrarenae TaxID=679257 RepID=A0ABS9J393_9FLAO|nr:iron-sulfur cluster repair di-iron protein [Joostella atrarenae]MCF8714825.1 iron-sulfur cluster repair di-iron protein [Joostella atrarenae]